MQSLTGYNTAGIGTSTPLSGHSNHATATASFDRSSRGEEVETNTPLQQRNLPCNGVREVPGKCLSHFELFTFADMMALPRPRWLVRGLLVEKTSSVLSADSGSFKSFFALDMALCVATGKPFHDREVQQGAAVYIAAEGFYTLADRATAWALFHERELPQNFSVLRVPVDVGNPATRRKFVESVSACSPALVVLDTLSQCSTGRNENSNDEMAEFMRGMMSAAEELGAHVQTLHHNGKHTGTMRGAGSIKANADAVISLERPQGDKHNTVFVRCEKQRGKPFDPFALRGVEVMLPEHAEHGEPVTSLVFALCEETITPQSAKHPNASRADQTRASLMRIFDQVSLDNKGGVKIGTWKGAVDKAGLCSDSTFWAQVKILKGNDEARTAPVIEAFGNYRRADLWRRVQPHSDNSDNSEKELSEQRHNHDDSNSNNSDDPLGVGVVGGGGVESKRGPPPPSRTH